MFAREMLTRGKMRKFHNEDGPERSEFGCSQLSALSSCLATRRRECPKQTRTPWRNPVSCYSNTAIRERTAGLWLLNSCQTAAVAQLAKTKHKEVVVNIKSALFWGLTHRRIVVPYGRFGTTYRFYIQGTEEMEPIGCTETSGHHRCAENKKSAQPVYNEEKASNHA
jgi:hypothetical protein